MLREKVIWRHVRSIGLCPCCDFFTSDGSPREGAIKRIAGRRIFGAVVPQFNWRDDAVPFVRAAGIRRGEKISGCFVAARRGGRESDNLEQISGSNFLGSHVWTTAENRGASITRLCWRRRWTSRRGGRGHTRIRLLFQFVLRWKFLTRWKKNTASIRSECTWLGNRWEAKVFGSTLSYGPG